MKVIVIGAFFILWMQNSCAAPKWTGDAAGDTFDDDLDLHTDMDFSDMELDYDPPTPNNGHPDYIDLHTDMIEYDYYGPSTYNSFQVGYDEEETPEIQIGPMKCTMKPPSLFWIGFTVLRLMYVAWFLTLLGSLSGKKDVDSVVPEYDDPEQGPFTDEPVENNATDAVDDMAALEDDESALGDWLQRVLNAVDDGEKEPPLDSQPNDLDQIPDDEYQADDWISKEAKGDQDHMEQVEDALIQDNVVTANGTELQVTMDPEHKLE